MVTSSPAGHPGGTTRYVPHLGAARGEPKIAVQLLRHLPDGVAVVVWQAVMDKPKAARSLHDWMWGKRGCWEIWGRIALRFGPDALTRLVTAGAADEEAARVEEERRHRDDQREQIRLSKLIELYLFDPKGGKPGLGFQRGNASTVFFKMRFSEKWERDRVCDWLVQQRHLYAEMAELFEEGGVDGQMALERHILAGMRETERDVKARGLAAGGRRPLRFWRGE